jgi:GTP-binding protein
MSGIGGAQQPFDFNSLSRYAEWLFAQSCHFIQSVPTLRDLPPVSLPEIAFAGRSNVGKSSLINAITRQRGLAHTSRTPGRTQHLNFFNLANTLYLVDLPGYGYAEAPKALVEGWTQLIIGYLKGRPSLKRVFLLIDSRHGLKPNDKKMMELLDQSAVSYQLVLTKIDKISDSALKEVCHHTHTSMACYAAVHPVLLATSSEKGWGLTELRHAIAALTVSRDIVEEGEYS